jgi:hypothetical protein
MKIPWLIGLILCYLRHLVVKCDCGLIKYDFNKPDVVFDAEAASGNGDLLEWDYSGAILWTKK